MLSRRDPEGDDFDMLGVEWDTSLTMEREVETLSRRCYWKLRTLVRSRRFFTTPQLVQQYKSHILPVLEFATPAIFHAAATDLEPLEKVQRTSIKEKLL